MKTIQFWSLNQATLLSQELVHLIRSIETSGNNLLEYRPEGNSNCEATKNEISLATTGNIFLKERDEMKNTHMFGQGKSQEAFEPEIFLILNLNKLVKAEIWILPP